MIMKDILNGKKYLMENEIPSRKIWLEELHEEFIFLIREISDITFDVNTGVLVKNS